MVSVEFTMVYACLVRYICIMRNPTVNRTSA